MARIGLFPLELVLLPTERVPLFVFEPRYKELIGECLERSEEFGIVLVKESGDLHHVGTRAAVAEVLQVLPDGRMHLVAAGGNRFRLLEVDHERSFDTGLVSELVDEDDPADPADLERALDLFARLQATLGAPGEPPPPETPQLDFAIAARVDFSTATKQELLELTSPRLRAARLAELLERALAALELDRELRRRAHGNGKVAPLD
ncbi:MAG TPA: LON peptidase substrate-binding domain-containing protein [Gaiellaceae bacterium]|nr:LON peptidase substrate-binding domain-containing protein [Gaiellaceae bacterium]